MENYFATLDLSATATLEEIKTQYELLMRVYHPARFADPLDKNYAEHKCAELTRAYRALLGDADWSTQIWNDEATLPRVDPTLIDWGIVHQGERLATQLYIYARRPVQWLRCRPDAAAMAWLRLGHTERARVGDKEIVSFGVTVNTEALVIGQRYIGQIKVEIDRVPRYVFLMLKIDPPYPDLCAQHRWLQASELHI